MRLKPKTPLSVEYGQLSRRAGWPKCVTDFFRANPSLRKHGQYIYSGSSSIAIVHFRREEKTKNDCGAGEMICVEYKKHREHTSQYNECKEHLAETLQSDNVTCTD